MSGRPAPGSPEARAKWLAWLGTPDCPCPDRWGNLGYLHGVSMGLGWIRIDTESSCPHHGVNAPPPKPPGSERGH